MFGKSLHILCFGDSLSAGFTLTGPELHPYEIAMKSTLQKAFPTYEITTDVQGVAGDQVVTPPGGFLTRMDILCESRWWPSMIISFSVWNGCFIQGKHLRVCSYIFR
jgi:hypothetical protein